ncbi:MAG TPA: hypothetical protein VFB45_22555 [Pseudolabrys sp.]|nr:hypothetical protein [Pseudolabrys sp.]
MGSKKQNAPHRLGGLLIGTALVMGVPLTASGAFAATDAYLEFNNNNTNQHHKHHKHHGGNQNNSSNTKSSPLAIPHQILTPQDSSTLSNSTTLGGSQKNGTTVNTSHSHK